MDYDLGLIGAGKMAEAIARAVLAAKLYPAGRIIASDVSPQRRELFQSELGIRAVEDNAAVASAAPTLVLAVKPQQLAAALAGLGGVMHPDALLISILAGVSTASIEKHLGQDKPWRVIRAMPNTPMQVGQGMVALCAGRHATAGDLSAARAIFASSAKVVAVSEDQMDAVTALSGSGPAYFFLLVELMIQAGVEMGLSPEHSRLLAIQTAVGAAKMLASTDAAPQDLRQAVTSPGGTTQAAIELMQARGVPQAIVAAIHRACQRSRELGT